MQEKRGRKRKNPHKKKKKKKRGLPLIYLRGKEKKMALEGKASPVEKMKKKGSNSLNIEKEWVYLKEKNRKRGGNIKKETRNSPNIPWGKGKKNITSNHCKSKE